MKLFRVSNNQKGSITIYLLIIFMALLIFLGIFVDLARLKMAENQVHAAMNAAARSTMADYNNTLKKEYLLFALEQPDQSTEIFNQYLKKNLKINQDNPGNSFDFFDFRLEESMVDSNIAALSEDEGDVLKHQILEAMKYRAPIEITRDLINKFSQLIPATQAFGRQNKIRKEKKARDEKLQKLSDNNGVIAEKKEAYDTAHSKLQNAEEELNNASEEDKPAARIERDKAKREQEKVLNEIKELNEANKALAEDIRAKNVDLDNSTVPPASEQETGQQGIDEIEADLNTGTRTALLTEKDFEDLNKDTIEIDTFLSDLQNDPTADEGETPTPIPIPEAVDKEGVKDKWKTGEIEPPDIPGVPELMARAAGLGKLIALLSSPNPEMPKEGDDPLANDKKEPDEDKLDNTTKTTTGIKEFLDPGKILVNQRDRIFINEYVLEYFSNATGDRGIPDKHPKKISLGNGVPKQVVSSFNPEVEYILYGGCERSATAEVLGKIFIQRTAVATVAYFFVVPGELITRAIFSVTLGLAQGAIDVITLLGEDSTGLVQLDFKIKGVPNPFEALEKVPVTYVDYLRLLFLMNSDEEGRLDRIQELIPGRHPSVNLAESNTYIEAEATVSIRLWFIPLIGQLGVKPFGHEIKNGRVYINKTVEYSY